MDTELQDHPIAAIFPLFAEKELSDLTEDIRQNGLQTPIWLYEGKILDGRNRYRACRTLGIQPVINYYTDSSPTAFVLSLNLQRRHLSASERAAVAVEALPHFEEEAKKRQIDLAGTRGSDLTERIPEGHESEISKLPYAEKGEAREKAAAMVGVNARYVSDAKTIKAASPETFEQVKRGEISINEAKAQLKPAPEPPEPAPDNQPQPSKGISYAEQAIQVLKRISLNDAERKAAGHLVTNWCKKNLN